MKEAALNPSEVMSMMNAESDYRAAVTALSVAREAFNAVVARNTEVLNGIVNAHNGLESDPDARWTLDVRGNDVYLVLVEDPEDAAGGDGEATAGG